MFVIRKENGFWTKERCKEESLKYKTRTEFNKYGSSAYKIACKNKWLDDICEHMINSRTLNHSYTFEICKKTALKYKTKKEFRENDNKIFMYSYRQGWLNELCSHMVSVGNKFKRIVYVFEFENNYVYVGLTYNPNERYERHMNDNKSSVYKHIKKTNLIPKYSIITEYLDTEEAQILEDETIKKYKENGWFILNKAKTGKNISSIGGNYNIWDLEKCKEEALKYNNRTEFNKKSSYCYAISYKNKWLDLICKHMIFIRYSRGYWNDIEKCKEEALKYKSKFEFQKAKNNAYRASLENGWLNDVCSHMVEIIKPKKYWNYEKCKEEALKYQTKTDFKENSKSAYRSALKNMWIDDISSHMIEKKKRNGYWDDIKNCKEEALKYEKMKDFRKKSSSAYQISYKNGWLDEICSHMKK